MSEKFEAEVDDFMETLVECGLDHEFYEAVRAMLVNRLNIAEDKGALAAVNKLMKGLEDESV